MYHTYQMIPSLVGGRAKRNLPSSPTILCCLLLRLLLRELSYFEKKRTRTLLQLAECFPCVELNLDIVQEVILWTGALYFKTWSLTEKLRYTHKQLPCGAKTLPCMHWNTDFTHLASICRVHLCSWNYTKFNRAPKVETNRPCHQEPKT